MTKRVNITDVAKLAGVSAATVSYYLNGHLDKMSEATQERIRKVIAETGYVPNAQARTLTSKATDVVAVLICNISNHWAGEVLRGMQEAARRHGYQTVVCETGFNAKTESECVEKMLSLGVDGFVIQPAAQVRSFRARLAKAEKPVVFYDYNAFDYDGCWVKCDLYNAFYSAVDECVERGYEDFVVLAADASGARTRTERLQGVSDALAAHGITARIVPITHEAPTADELRRFLERELNPTRRTLVVVPHQWALARVCLAIQPMTHLVPQQIGVLGIDSMEWSSLASPSLTTIVEPIREEGETAVEMLAGLLAGTVTSEHRILKCATNWLGSTL